MPLTLDFSLPEEGLHRVTIPPAGPIHAAWEFLQTEEPQGKYFFKLIISKMNYSIEQYVYYFTDYQTAVNFKMRFR